MSKLQLALAFCLLLGFSFYAEARRIGRRRTRRVGGGYLQPSDPDDPEVISFARWAAKELEGTLLSVTSAHEQVVAGWMYHITMRMKSKEQKVERCRVKVWVRQWMNSVKLVDAMCTPVRIGAHLRTRHVSEF